MTFENIEWLFFDVGSTLVDESEVYVDRINKIAKAAGKTHDEVYKKSIEFYRKGLKGDLETAAFYGVPLPKWQPQYENPYPAAAEVLEKLGGRYKLGVIANQSLGTADRLKKYGLLEYFSLVVASAEEGIAKPDRRIFDIALERSGCKPENAVMIGDRVDNDILPAKAVGMKTVLVGQGLSSLSEEKYQDRDAYVSSIEELPDLLM